jgi:hypothetical protein
MESSEKLLLTWRVILESSGGHRRYPPLLKSYRRGVWVWQVPDQRLQQDTAVQGPAAHAARLRALEVRLGAAAGVCHPLPRQASSWFMIKHDVIGRDQKEEM